VKSSPFETRIADLGDRASVEQALTGVAIAICAAGPYQKLPLFLSELCVQRGIHYIDLADDRAFVHRLRVMVSKQGNSRAAVCTAWSTVSATSGLLVKIASAGMKSVTSIYIHMAPGNRGARATGTVASLLHSVGRSFTVFRNGEWHQTAGWSEPRDFSFPSPVGKRRGYLVDVPDHEIFPELFDARTVEFRAGSELPFLNRCVAQLQRTRRDWTTWAGVFQRALALLSWAGHDFGGVGVEVDGDGRRRTACIVAESRSERIAVMPAGVMTNLLVSGSDRRGLISYSDWLNEEEFRTECDRRGFRLVVEDC
jgi:hypothetical protein